MTDIPDIIKNQNNFDISYQVGKFLGKGSFAKCYEFRQISDRKVYAGKVVPKKLLSNDLVKVWIWISTSYMINGLSTNKLPNIKEKMDSEIKIHRSLKHKHIVDFIDSFESKFVTIRSSLLPLGQELSRI